MTNMEKRENILKKNEGIHFYDTELYSTFSKFLKSKQSIRTIQLDGYIKMCVQIKFYICLDFLTIY